MAVTVQDATEPRIAASGITAAVIGEDDPVMQRVAGVLREHRYHVVFHPSPDDLLAGSPYKSGSPGAIKGERRSAYVLTSEAGRPSLYVLNCKGPTRRGEGYPVWADAWLSAMKALNEQSPRTAILVAVGSGKSHDLIKVALAAGADEILRAGDAEIEELVWTRVQSALAKAEASPADAPDARPSASRATTGDVVEEWDEPATPEEIRAAHERVRTALNGIPGPEERQGPLADLLGVRVPALRAASGRLDAKKIADELGISLSRLARIAPISRQALNETPDSVRAQGALDPLARTLHVLGTVLPGEHVRAWLYAPHARLGGQTPIDAILEGRAEQVARMVEMARDGGVD